MMYSNKMAVAIKANGKVLREFGNSVYVPYGQEYSFLIKNLDSVRAKVRISVDGTDATEGTWLVVPANDSIELMRYIKQGNLEAGNRFKFVERNEAIENGPRGIKIDDGLIRIEFLFERKTNQYNYTNQLATSSILRDARIGGANATYACNTVPLKSSKSTSVGITVPGSVSTQKFQNSSWFPTEETSHVMVLQLVGEVDGGTQVTKPVSVKTKLTCITCGQTSKATATFCSACGTSLHIT